MSALLLTFPLGKYFGFDEIWDDATAVEGLRQVGEAGQACYWIHHKVAVRRHLARRQRRVPVRLGRAAHRSVLLVAQLERDEARARRRRRRPRGRSVAAAEHAVGHLGGAARQSLVSQEEQSTRCTMSSSELRRLW